MKILNSAVLAFVAAQTASAFVVQHPQTTTVLRSSSYFDGNGMSGGPQVTSAAFANDAGGAMAPGIGPRGDKIEDIWDTLNPITVQGGSLRTWSFTTPYVERVQVLMKTEGRPLNANIELWHGPDNTPQKVAVYLEDGNLRPFSAVIETPRGHNAVAIYNTGHLEFPLSACVEAELSDGRGAVGLGAATQSLSEMSTSKTVQGGAIHTIPFAIAVESVALLLKTDGRPLNARIELLQGPNNNKQIMEVYTEDGLERPFYAVIETPGVGNVVRVCNTATVEFPLTASVEPYLVTPGGDNFPSEYDRGWDESSNSFYFLNP
jgi:hypothetical protein